MSIPNLLQFDLYVVAATFEQFSIFRQAAVLWIIIDVRICSLFFQPNSKWAWNRESWHSDHSANNLLVLLLASLTILREQMMLLRVENILMIIRV